MPPTPAPHLRKHATHVTHASTSPTPHMLARHQGKHAITSPTLAPHPRKHVTHATHASTNSTPFLKLDGGRPRVSFLNLRFGASFTFKLITGF